VREGEKQGVLRVRRIMRERERGGKGERETEREREKLVMAFPVAYRRGLRGLNM